MIAEVNPAMPRTRGTSGIPLERIDAFVAADRPLAEYVHEPADAEADQIAAYVARLVDDGSTLQVGVGRVASQMLAQLVDRRDLAIHSDAVADLVAAGVVTGRVVASWAVGTRRLYDLVDDDERFAFHPIEHVCDPAVIAAQPRMVSVTRPSPSISAGRSAPSRSTGSSTAASRPARPSTAARSRRRAGRRSSAWRRGRRRAAPRSARSSRPARRWRSPAATSTGW